MYENVTYESILGRMLARVPDKFDKREGSVIWDTHSPTAIELQILYLELDTILREAYGDTASRSFLILRCRERGITPYQATRAVLKGTVTPADVDITGKRFNIGKIYYTAVEKIADGSYQFQCDTAGITGNQYLGTIIPVEYIQGLQTVQLTQVLIPGEEEEGTEELRQRYFASFDEKAFGGNQADYIQKVNALPGVGRTKVTRLWNGGIRPAEMIPSDTVKAWYESAIETMDKDVAGWLSSVYRAAAEKRLAVGGTVLLTILDSDYNAASDVLVSQVQNELDPEETAGEGYGLAPIGHVVTVKSARELAIHVKTSLTFERGYGWNNLHQAINDAMAGYLLELRKTWAELPCLTVRTRQIENRILNITGVVDMRDTLINDSAENLVLDAYEIPVLGGVDI